MGFEKEKKQGWNLVCGLPAVKEGQESPVTKRASIADGKKPTEVAPNPRSGKIYLTRTRRMRFGGGVKIRDAEEEKEVKKEVKKEVEKDESDGEVEILDEAPPGCVAEPVAPVAPVIELSNDEDTFPDAKVAKYNEVLVELLDKLPPEAIEDEFGY